MGQLKESIRKEAEARAQVQDATEELKDLGRRDPTVAARDEASSNRVEEIMSGQAKGFEGFRGTRNEAQLIADQERLSELKHAIARRQEAQQLPNRRQLLRKPRKSDAKYQKAFLLLLRHRPSS
jgi:hypothetical protein